MAFKYLQLNFIQLNRRFVGFRNTPLLWEDTLESLIMYKTDDPSSTDCPKIDSKPRIRLGKLVEKFILHDLDQNTSIEILRSNIQIFQDQITIGELDALIKQLEEYIHLEIVYKFYLYDPSISTELNRWIGPNRNDSLIQKLHKLKEKQLPLLYRPETANILNELHIKVADVTQRLYFKAQLFVPIDSLETSFPFINNNCVKGFYIRKKNLSFFENHRFYIPAKLDWLIEPHLGVAWISKPNFEVSASKFLNDGKSPLCWIQSPEGNLKKFFIVWWD